ncbi:MAG: cytosolic Fe-S cluster assembly factor cfd1, partial [Sporothrix thermara]
ELNFCVKTSIRVLGVVENMSGFVCPNCSECTDVFMRGGGKAMADDFGVPYLGAVPLDPQFVVLVESGRTPVYPAGTQVQGADFVPPPPEAPEEEATGDAGQDGRKRGLFVQKYRSCSLEPIFRGITAEVIKASTA